MKLPRIKFVRYGHSKSGFIPNDVTIQNCVQSAKGNERGVLVLAGIRKEEMSSQDSSYCVCPLYNFAATE